MNSSNPTSVARKAVAGAMALLMALMPMGPGAFAAATILSDQPILAKVAAKPNLLFTLDDSGSMARSYIPDFVMTGPGQVAPDNAGPGYCRALPGSGVPLTSIPAPLRGCSSTFSWGRDVPMFAAEFNKLYYNPDVNYDPPINGAGNQASMASPDGAPAATIYKMQTSLKTTGWTVVKNDAYDIASATTNLIPTVAVPVYCNTDWPRGNPLETDAVNTAALMLPLVANALGEYSATAGKDCRINGTSYDALGGSPAVADDYNYPYYWAAVGVKDTKYFYRNGGNRQIWCKRNGPGWPQTCALTGCSVAMTITPPVAQTCYQQGTQPSGPDPSNFLPIGCNLWAPGIGQPVGGCIGSIGVGGECLACNNANMTTGKAGLCRLTSGGGPPGTGGSGAACSCSSGAGCTLPACPDYDPPDTCSGTPTYTCNKQANADCDSTYATTTNAHGGVTLLSDANGVGDTCRRNNKGTGSYITTHFTYPESSVANDNLYNKLVSNSCGAVQTTVNIPRHYYTLASAQFCNTIHPVAVNTPWRGFGTPGVCQTKNDFATHFNVNYGKFTRIGLINDGRTFAFTDPFTGISGTRTYAEEMTNYANWFTYYRTRILTAKTTTAIAFNIVDNKYRAGFHVMTNVAPNWLNSADFVSGPGLHRENWYTKLFGVTITGGAKTPTLDAMIRIGQLVENGAGAVAGLPAHTDPIPTITGNPVSCTNNYHILFTDGFTDQIALPTVAGERDGTNVPTRASTVVGLPALPADPGAAEPTRTLPGLDTFVGAAWPKPFKDATTATADSLADIALLYWMRDLRPGMLNDVPAHDGRPIKDSFGNVIAYRDLDWRKDPAWWQHVNFSALSYGADGMLDASNRVNVENEIAAGTYEWFTTPNYPAPPNNSPFPTANRRATSADDLWHATVNARGKFAFAQTPYEVAYGLGSIIAGTGNNAVARVGATFASRNLGPANDFFYVATIEPGWSGDLKKVTINTLTAAQGATRWSALGALDALLQTPLPGTSPAADTDNAWFLNRRIVTRKSDVGPFTVVPFRHADLGTTQLNSLSTNVTQQQKIISYLRGGSTFGAGPNPLQIEGTNIGQYRERTGKLGNISDSKPVVVGPPNKPYRDADDFGYANYKSTNSARSLRVFAGANDGMFHVFDGTDAASGGSEVYAYIPSAVYNTSFDEGGKARKGIQALTYQDGGAPIFKHHFYVNGSPTAADVDFANCGSNNTTCTPAWRTIVVAGLGKGGNTYFALNATDPLAATEAAAASKVLWEFNLPNSQFSYGNPLIAKTRAFGWVVVIASGYNNTLDGKGHIHFLSASTGTVLHTLNTTGLDTGTLANPSGLTKLSGYGKDDANQIMEQIYGGDLYGRVWRWDVADANYLTWQGKTRLFATLTDPGGAAQPVTTAPEIEIDLNNGVDRYVFVGTGRLLDSDDLVNPSPEQIQTMYALRDGTLDTPSAAVPISGRAVTAVVVDETGAPGPAPNGWKHDMPLGQRVVVDPVAEFNVVLYAGSELQPDPCLTTLPAYVYGRDYVSAQSVIYSGGVAQPYFFTTQGAVGLEIVALYDPLKSFPVLAGFASSGGASGGGQPVEIIPKSFGGGHRLSWRLLGE